MRGEMERQIWALIHTAKKSGKTVYGISFPDFPGVASGGANMDEAIERGRSALAFHLDGLVEDGEVVPVQRSLKALSGDLDVQNAVRTEGAVIVQVPVDLRTMEQK